MDLKEYESFKEKISQIAIRRGCIEGTAEYYGFIEGANYLLFSTIGIDTMDGTLEDLAHTYANGLGRDKADKMDIYAKYKAGGKAIIDCIKQRVLS